MYLPCSTGPSNSISRVNPERVPKYLPAITCALLDTRDSLSSQIRQLPSIHVSNVTTGRRSAPISRTMASHASDNCSRCSSRSGEATRARANRCSSATRSRITRPTSPQRTEVAMIGRTIATATAATRAGDPPTANRPSASWTASRIAHPNAYTHLVPVLPCYSASRP